MSNDLEVFFAKTCGSNLQASKHLFDRNLVRFALDD
jgi:hypothetical protein